MTGLGESCAAHRVRASDATSRGESTGPCSFGQAGLSGALRARRPRASLDRSETIFDPDGASYTGMIPVDRAAVRGARQPGSIATSQKGQRMGVSSGQSRVADLSFQVFRRPMHPDWFGTKTFRRVERREWVADLRIIDGGHAVFFRSGSVGLTEVLSGQETALPEPGRLLQCHLRRERTALLRPGGLLEYQTCLDVERVDLEVFRHLCEELTLDATRDGLFHRFRWPNRLAPPPLSLIHVEPRATSLVIHAFHTFPDECAIVRTQSLFELDSAASAR